MLNGDFIFMVWGLSLRTSIFMKYKSLHMEHVRIKPLDYTFIMYVVNFRCIPKPQNIFKSAEFVLIKLFSLLC